MEAVVTLATALKEYEFDMVPGFDPGMTTGDPRPFLPMTSSFSKAFCALITSM
jgi:hypothetical protein